MQYGPKIVTDSLVLALDAADNNSAPHNDLPVKQGCIGWYDGDDSTVFSYSSGTAVSEWRDKSGNSNHLTMSNGPTRSVTQNSKSGLAFNGSSQWGNAVTGGAISETTMIAVCSLATLTPSGNNSGGGVVSVNQHSADNFNAIVYNEYTAKRWMNGSSSWTRTPNTVSTSDETSTGPHIISNAIKTGAFNLYRNGTNLTSTSYTYSAQTNGKIVIGNRHTNSGNSPVSNGYWYGNIYEVIVYDRVLSSDELTKVHNYLQNKWDIKVSDAKWYDQTASGLNGSFNGQPIYSETNKGYFYTDGTDDYISTSDSSILDISGDKSLAIWVYLGADSSGCGFVGKAHNTEKGMALAYGWNSQGFQNIAWNNLNAPQLSKDTNRDVQKWIYLVGTQDGSTRYVYAVDDQGTRSASATGGTSTWVNQHGLIIGRVASGSPVPSGTRFGSVSVYSKALSADEVAQNYNATKSRYNL